MKKIHFLSAAFMLVALSAGFTSCSNDDEMDKPIYKEEIKETDKDIEALPLTTLDEAKDLEVTGTLTLASGPIRTIHILDAERLIASTSPAGASIRKTRGAEEMYKEGAYKINADGSITATVNGFRLNISANKRTVVVNDKTYTAEVSAATTTSANTASLCRTWYPSAYNIVVYAGPKAIGCYESSSILTIRQTLSHELGTDVELLRDEVDYISIMNNGNFITNYKGSNYQVANWNWTDEKKGELTADFSAIDKYLMDIPSFARFKNGNPHICYLVSSIGVKVTGLNNEAFTADIKLIITMKDAK